MNFYKLEIIIDDFANMPLGMCACVLVCARVYVCI